MDLSLREKLGATLAMIAEELSMRRYRHSREALAEAMRSMVDEQDTLLVAAISHCLDMLTRRMADVQQVL